MKFSRGDKVLICNEDLGFHDEEGTIIIVRGENFTYQYEVAYADTAGSFKESWLKPMPNPIANWLQGKQ